MESMKQNQRRKFNAYVFGCVSL